ncbi:hypothetical protein [Modestobacter sp. NPDC049651]|uniref:alpha/beta hydrolase family protein n=1 Tax=unclassified Modestobacter TaxID=2643866 RepID=UPI00340760E2
MPDGGGRPLDRHLAARLLTLACCLVLAAAVLAGCGSEQPSAPAPQPVATRTLALHDASRDTAAGDHDRAARAGRDLPTSLWYPEHGRGPFPVVVFSHGLAARPAGFADLLSGWAAAGFVVAAPQFPLTSQGSSDDDLTDVLNQPADVAFVLTQVLALDRAPGDPLEGRIDERHIAAAGHSAGAATTLGLLFSCCQDPRITAAVVLAGTTLGNPVAFAGRPVPVLFVHGSGDTLAPIDAARDICAAAPGPTAFVTLTDGEHARPFYDPRDPQERIVRSVTADFLRWTLRSEASVVSRLRADAHHPGLAELTHDGLPA